MTILSYIGCITKLYDGSSYDHHMHALIWRYICEYKMNLIFFIV